MPESFEAFAAARWTRLARTAYLLTGDYHEAEDLVQQTLVKAYPHWQRIRRLDAPDAYLRRALLNNRLTGHSRRRARQLLMPWVPERPAASETARVEQRSLLMEALGTLPPRQRAVLVLRFWEDLSEQQVAEALGCSVGTVKSQASRALAKLRVHPALAGFDGNSAFGEER
jgi:RNA polymerase sigma-70 factor (sigma-E family)